MCARADSFAGNSYHVFASLTAVSARITSPRSYPALLGVLSAASFCSFVRAGDPRLEDKVPREFPGLAVRENASGATMLRAERKRCSEGKRRHAGLPADKYISRLNPASPAQSQRSRSTSIRGVVLYTCLSGYLIRCSRRRVRRV